MKFFSATVCILISLCTLEKGMACEVQEAQYIGKVKNYNVIQRSESVEECFYEIGYTMFNSSYACPLEIGEVSLEKFQDYSCQLRNGNIVSGVIVKQGEKVFLR